MRTLFLTLIAIHLLFTTRAQSIRETHSPCLQGGIYFTTQQEIDNFHTDYPGCDVIIGELEIYGDSITNLNGLLGIKGIYSGLQIHDASQLTSLAGLDSVEYLIGVEISNTPLTSLEGLGKVNSTGISIFIHDMPTLNSLDGFGNYPLVVNYLKIWNCDALTSLDGLEAITEIGSPFSLKENNSLVTISGLDNLTQLGSIEIENNVSLTSIQDLNEGITAYIGHLNIFGNTSLSLCNAPVICNFLTESAGYLRIYGNAQGCERPAQIAASCGFTMPCLPQGMYYLTSQVAVDSFAFDYPGCKDLKGNLIVQGPEIHDLSGLMGVTSDSGMVMIFNTNLANLHGLDSLKSVYAHLYIGEDFNSGNDSLTSLTGLENLETVGMRLNVNDNRQLLNLEGLSNVKKVGILDVGLNESLTSFQGLNQLDTVTKYIDIYYNESLTDISSLLCVKSVNESLDIYGNSVLESLYGLDNIVPGGGFRSLYIRDNPLLKECDVLPVCNILQNNSGQYIQNNAPGCNSVDEVLYACGVGIKDQLIKNVKIYPNPAVNYIMVTLSQVPSNCQMTIFNASGMQVMKSTLSNATERINISNFPKGMYLVHIASDTGISIGKLLKE